MQNKNKDISVNVGSGVSRVQIEIPNTDIQTQSTPILNSEADQDSNQNQKDKPQPIELVEFNDRFIYNNVGQKTYYNKAFFKGQSRQPGMYKLGYPKAKLFVLHTEEDLERYNTFLAQIGGEGEDPQIANLTIDRKFHEGKFVVLASYNEMWYLLPEQK